MARRYTFNSQEAYSDPDLGLPSGSLTSSTKHSNCLSDINSDFKYTMYNSFCPTDTGSRNTEPSGCKIAARRPDGDTSILALVRNSSRPTPSNARIKGYFDCNPGCMA